MAIPEIGYLRWIRRPATHEGVRISFALSGMSSPDPSFLEGIPPGAFIEGVGVDHPDLALEIARDEGLDARQVLVQPGSHWNLFLAIAARLNRSFGPVIVEQPAYEPLHRIPAALGAPVLRLPRSRAKGRALDLTALAALSGQKPSLLLLSHPHNPSMATLSSGEKEGLAEWAGETGCAVLSDEVYLEFLEEPAQQSLRAVLSQAAVIRSFTKVMGLGAIRCSILVADEEWIVAAAALSDYGPVFLSVPSQAVARAAWRRRREFWARARALSAERRPLVRQWADSVSELLELEMNEAGIIAFGVVHPAVARAAAEMARRRGVTGDFGFGLDGDPDSSVWWIEDLKRRHGVLVTPGAFFEEPAGFRLGFGVDEKILEEGLELLSSHLRAAASAGS